MDDEFKDGFTEKQIHAAIELANVACDGDVYNVQMHLDFFFEKLKGIARKTKRQKARKQKTPTKKRADLYRMRTD